MTKMIYVDESKLEMAFDLLKTNPETETKTLIDLVKVPEGTWSKGTLRIVEDPSKPFQLDNVDLNNKNESRFGKKWTENEELELIAMKRNERTNGHIADVLSRTERSVVQKIRKLKKAGVLEGELRSARRYEPEEKEHIKELLYHWNHFGNIPDHEIVELSKKLKRTKKAIQDQLMLFQKSVTNREDENK